MLSLLCKYQCHIAGTADFHPQHMISLFKKNGYRAEGVDKRMQSFLRIDSLTAVGWSLALDGLHGLNK
jgi:hypothetical protein